MKNKLVLKCNLALGDIVLLTAAVRDLHRCYPGKFATDVRTSFPELWENNPYLTKLREDDREAEVIECSYPLIDFSNQAPYHCLHGFIDFLNQELNLQIRPTLFKGDVHLSQQEKLWYSQVHELAQENIPFWIVAAGGKYDLTIKWWDIKRYQEVIDQFREKIQFVQVGSHGHYHPKLEGVIDLRGRTDPRQLIRLIYHSQGVLCPVTGMMHLAAAVQCKSKRWQTRPCVVIAGGREPAHWEAYPGHQFIHRNGALACGGEGGCWRDRTYPLRDGDKRDRPGNLCLDVVNGLPRCMDMITPEEVIGRIETYFVGGKAEYLNTRQQAAAERAILASTRNDYDRQPLNLQGAAMACDKFVHQIPTYPASRFSGRGIVICGGGVRYFTCAWVCIHLLRDHGCKLPIEFWYLGAAEMDHAMRQLLEAPGVECMDALQVRKQFPVRRLKGWELKPYAILHSRFQQVLLLDADNVPVRNPEYLFESAQFQQTGAIFWPDYDYPKDKKAKIIWRSCGLRQPAEREFETGQILVDKQRCWSALCLTLWFNANSDLYYQYFHGDKETFHLAFRKLRTKYSLIATAIESLEGTMCQHDFNGQRIFQHRNSDKWDLFLRNRRIPGFLLDEQCRNHVRRLQKLWDGRAGDFVKSRPASKVRTRTNSWRVYYQRDLSIHALMISGVARAALRYQTLENWSRTDWKESLQIHLYDGESRDPKKQSDSLAEALKSCLRRKERYFLLLEDDLDFNRFLRHNLETWPPLREDRAGLASLYNPSVRELACDLNNDARYVAPRDAFGSQAFLISRGLAEFLVHNWDRIEAAAPDLKIARLAGRKHKTILYHAPSLVQHVDPVKERGGIYDRAMDFDPNWKRTNQTLLGPADKYLMRESLCTISNGNPTFNPQATGFA